MKKAIKVIGLALSAALIVASFAACGGDKNPGATNSPKATAQPTPTIPGTLLSNYVVKYTVTETVTENVEKEDGSKQYETFEKTTNYVQVGYQGMYFNSTDGGETYTMGDASVFAVESQTDPRGFFTAHNKLLTSTEKVENLGEDTVAGHKTTHYHYKNGLFDYDLYVSDELCLTLKYVSNAEPKKSLVVTEILEGAVDSQDGWNFIDIQGKVVTPAPAETPEEGAPEK